MSILLAALLVAGIREPTTDPSGNPLDAAHPLLGCNCTTGGFSSWVKPSSPSGGQVRPCPFGWIPLSMLPVQWNSVCVFKTGCPDGHEVCYGPPASNPGTIQYPEATIP